MTGFTGSDSVACVEGGMRPATKDDQIDPKIGPKKKDDKGIAMNNVLEAVVKDLNKLEETLISREVRVHPSGELKAGTRKEGRTAEYEDGYKMRQAADIEQKQKASDDNGVEVMRARIAARRAAEAAKKPAKASGGILDKVKSIFASVEQDLSQPVNESFVSELDEAITKNLFNKVSGYVNDTINMAKQGIKTKDAKGDKPDVGDWGVLVGPNDPPHHGSMAKKKEPETIVADVNTPSTPAAPVVESIRKVTGFRGLFKEGMQVSGDHRNRARRKMASWMGV